MRWLLLSFLVACTSTSKPAPDAGADSGDLPPLGGSRPLQTFRTPDGWDGKTPLPLLLVIHGYGVGGLAQALYFSVLPLVEEKQILLAAPDGLFDSMGKRYWNAVDTCCDFDHTNVDDVKYLTGLVDEIAARYPVDRKRIYLIGHSNGGAMTLRIACDKTSTFAAALELAGPFWSDFSKCTPSAPIPLRVLHGTADMEVPYDGANGAVAVSGFFAQKNGCTSMLDPNAPALDLDSSLAGAETKVSRYTGCMADTELWTIQGAGHIPTLVPNFRNIVWDFFSAHTR